MNHNHTHEAGVSAPAFLMTGGSMNAFEPGDIVRITEDRSPWCGQMGTVEPANHQASA